MYQHTHIQIPAHPRASGPSAAFCRMLFRAEVSKAVRSSPWPPTKAEAKGSKKNLWNEIWMICGLYSDDIWIILGWYWRFFWCYWDDLGWYLDEKMVVILLITVKYCKYIGIQVTIFEKSGRRICWAKAMADYWFPPCNWWRIPLIHCSQWDHPIPPLDVFCHFRVPPFKLVQLPM